MQLQPWRILALTVLGIAPLSADDVMPSLGTKGSALLEESFDGEELPKTWIVKSGKVEIVSGELHASQDRDAGRLGLFDLEQPMQDAAVQIDFKFDGAFGLNVGFNPSSGELQKKGHLLSVMISPRQWNITEHNDKRDRASQSKALASASAKFEQGRWYTLLLESKGNDVVAQVKGFEQLRATSPDFHVKKPGLAFRVLGRDGGSVSFDNLRIWELE